MASTLEVRVDSVVLFLKNCRSEALLSMAKLRQSFVLLLEIGIQVGIIVSFTLHVVLKSVIKKNENVWIQSLASAWFRRVWLCVCSRYRGALVPVDFNWYHLSECHLNYCWACVLVFGFFFCFCWIILNWNATLGWLYIF